MEILSIIIFFVMAYGFGHSITYSQKWDAPAYEKFFMNVGFGLAIIPVLGVLFSLLNIPINIILFLVLSLIIPCYQLIDKKIKKPSFNKDFCYFAIVLILSCIFFAVYLKGSFAYPYLEDDDPWHHAAGITYIKQTESITPTIDMIKGSKFYLTPYPPGYDTLMGLLNQITDDAVWTLKFFNTLILSLINILFYFFACTFLKSKKKAALATFFLIIIPCFTSHFIWASSLAILLFFPALYAIERNWILPGSIAIAGMIMTQMSNPFIFGIMLFIYICIKSIAKLQFQTKVLLTGIIGLFIGCLFWIPTIMTYGFETTANANSIQLGNIESINTKESGGGLIYTWKDFVLARPYNKIDNPIGVGIFLSILLIISLITIIIKSIKEKGITAWKSISILWLTLAFIGIHGNRLPFTMLMPHRWWAILAIPAALLCVEGFLTLGHYVEKYQIPRAIIYTILIIGVLITSAHPKYVVETATWPPGNAWKTYAQPNEWNLQIAQQNNKICWIGEAECT